MIRAKKESKSAKICRAKVSTTKVMILYGNTIKNYSLYKGFSASFYSRRCYMSKCPKMMAPGVVPAGLGFVVQCVKAYFSKRNKRWHAFGAVILHIL